MKRSCAKTSKPGAAHFPTGGQALILGMLLMCSGFCEAGSFRCGTKIVITGDSINRLLESCGAPDLKYKAKETLRTDGKRQATGVTHWIYSRGNKKNMVVSLRSGKVVKIAID